MSSLGGQTNNEKNLLDKKFSINLEPITVSSKIELFLFRY